MLIFSVFQQANRAVKLRNLGQRPRNMLAKAGEADRHIQTKVVDGVETIYTGTGRPLNYFFSSPNICFPARGRGGRQTDDDCLSCFCLLVLHSILHVCISWDHLHIDMSTKLLNELDTNSLPDIFLSPRVVYRA
jgi:hypothetical protein